MARAFAAFWVKTSEDPGASAGRPAPPLATIHTLSQSLHKERNKKNKNLVSGNYSPFVCHSAIEFQLKFRIMA